MRIGNRKTGTESRIKKEIKGELMRKRKKKKISKEKRYCTVYIMFYPLLSDGKDSIFIYLECELFIYKLYGLIVFTTTSVNDATYEYIYPFTLWNVKDMKNPGNLHF